ncbi:MAG: hypothetical protein GEU93_11910 [Propionibacteriales bacterium]|nr:hypothetical protein [Propionibacteriales bacterium]
MHHPRVMGRCLDNHPVSTAVNNVRNDGPELVELTEVPLARLRKMPHGYTFPLDSIVEAHIHGAVAVDPADLSRRPLADRGGQLAGRDHCVALTQITNRHAGEPSHRTTVMVRSSCPGWWFTGGYHPRCARLWGRVWPASRSLHSGRSV